MNTSSKKLKLLFLPFILILVVFCSVYTFLNWLLVIKLQLFTGYDLYPNFVGPLILSIIPVYIWLRPKVNLLNVKDKYGQKSSFGYCMVACMLISFPTIAAQEYLVTATSKLTQLQNINEINNHEPTKYYMLKDCFIDKEHPGVNIMCYVSGKHSSNYDMNIYMVFPVLHPVNISNYTPVGKNRLLVMNGVPLLNTATLNTFKPEDIDSMTVINDTVATTMYGIPGKNGAVIMHVYEAALDKYKFMTKTDADTARAWLGLNYFKSISNNLSIEEKNKIYEAFTKSIDKELATMDLKRFVYLEKAKNSPELMHYETAISNNTTYSVKSDIVLFAHNESFADHNGEKPLWFIALTLIAVFIWWLMILFANFDMAELRKRQGYGYYHSR
ncbi:MAG: hypothetical protein U0U67_12830 [Chitinophagales bacterium]